MFDGYEFYFMPKKQIRTQVQILKKKIQERGGVISDLQRDTTTHIVDASGARREILAVNKECTPQQYQYLSSFKNGLKTFLFREAFL